ncbi:MAG: HAD-IIIA family hydrolase [Bacilli bacterium]|nr:HAD-IIIA family hydrolase [Bacilli bacterium]
MRLFQPTMYQKSIFEINYSQLKKLGITCLVFDLDNTLGMIHHKKCPQQVKELVKELKKDFLVLICSNNFKNRIQPYLEELEVEGICLSMKPTTIGLKSILKKYHLKKEEMCLIGDQMLTDILSGNRFHIKTILVDPMGEKDLKITNLNRKIENKIIKQYQKKGVFERGKYYE